MNIPDELKVGGLTIVSIAVLILGFSFLKGANPFAKDLDIVVLIDDASRVDPASPVAMHGIKIGKVQDVMQAKNDSFEVVFNLSLKHKIQIPVESTVRIVELDLLGSKELRITPSDQTSYLQDGDTIIGFVQGGLMASITNQLDDKLDPLIDGVVPLIARVDTLIMNLNTSLMEGEEGSLNDMLGSVRRSLNNVEGITARINVLMANQSENIEGIVENANTITASIAENTGQIDSIMSNLNGFTTKLNTVELDAIIESANSAMVEVDKLMKSINNAEGTVGKLLHEDGIYTALDSTFIHLNALLEDVKANPKRYVSFSVFGGRK